MNSLLHVDSIQKEVHFQEFQ